MHRLEFAEVSATGHELPTPEQLGHQFDGTGTGLEHEEFAGIERIEMVVRHNTRFGEEQSASPDKVLVPHAPERKLGLVLSLSDAKEKALHDAAAFAGTKEERPQNNFCLRDRLVHEIVAQGDEGRMRAPDSSPAQNREPQCEERYRQRDYRYDRREERKVHVRLAVEVAR